MSNTEGKQTPNQTPQPRDLRPKTAVDLAALMPDILDLIDLERRGWETKARLLTRIAWETAGRPYAAAAMGRREMSKMFDRSLPEARWDIKVLDELVAHHRIVAREGRWCRIVGANVEAVRHWVEVPWKHSAHRSIRRLRVTSAGVSCRKVAVQPSDQERCGGEGAVGTRFGHLSDIDLSVVRPPPFGRQPPLFGNSDAQSESSTATFRQPGDPSCLLLRDTSYLSLSLGAEGESEGGASTEAEAHLAARLAAALARPDAVLVGRPLARVRALARLHVGHGEALLAQAAAMRDIRSFLAVLDALEAWAPAPAPAMSGCGICGQMMLPGGRYPRCLEVTCPGRAS